MDVRGTPILPAKLDTTTSEPAEAATVEHERISPAKTRPSGRKGASSTEATRDPGLPSDLESVGHLDPGRQDHPSVLTIRLYELVHGEGGEPDVAEGVDREHAADNGEVRLGQPIPVKAAQSRPRQAVPLYSHSLTQKRTSDGLGDIPVGDVVEDEHVDAAQELHGLSAMSPSALGSALPLTTMPRTHLVYDALCGGLGAKVSSHDLD
jgi:hypothetical protein